MGEKTESTTFNVPLKNILKKFTDDDFLDVCDKIVQLLDSYEDRQYEMLGYFLNELVGRYEESLQREEYWIKELIEIEQRNEGSDR